MVITDIWERKGVNGSVNIVVVLQLIHWLESHLDADESDDMGIGHEIIIVDRI